MIYEDMKNYFAVLSACLIALLPCISFAQEQPQWKRILNEAHTLPDSICLLSIGFPGPYTVERWPSNAVLVETILEVDNAPEGIFLDFLKKRSLCLETAVRWPGMPAQLPQPIAVVCPNVSGHYSGKTERPGFYTGKF
jgi:hypothetical protein